MFIICMTHWQWCWSGLLPFCQIRNFLSDPIKKKMHFFMFWQNGFFCKKKIKHKVNNQKYIYRERCSTNCLRYSSCLLCAKRLDPDSVQNWPDLQHCSKGWHNKGEILPSYPKQRNQLKNKLTSPVLQCPKRKPKKWKIRNTHMISNTSVRGYLS